jgi:hypothetical protein
MADAMSSPNRSRWLDERDVDRHQVRLPIRVRSALMGDVPGILLNVSVLGMHISTPFALQRGADATINLHGEADHLCRVAWSVYGFAGLQFTAPLSDAAVTRIMHISNHQR